MQKIFQNLYFKKQKDSIIKVLLDILTCCINVNFFALWFLHKQNKIKLLDGNIDISFLLILSLLYQG